VDASKPESLVNLTGSVGGVLLTSKAFLAAGVALLAHVLGTATHGHAAAIMLAAAIACGYVYQGPPFRHDNGRPLPLSLHLVHPAPCACCMSTSSVTTSTPGAGAALVVPLLPHTHMYHTTCRVSLLQAELPWTGGAAVLHCIWAARHASLLSCTQWTADSCSCAPAGVAGWLLGWCYNQRHPVLQPLAPDRGRCLGGQAVTARAHRHGACVCGEQLVATLLCALLSS
jgi:hypothetical protein